MKYLSLVGALASLLVTTSAHAGLLDLINKASDTVQQVNSTINNVPSLPGAKSDADQPFGHAGPADGIRKNYEFPFHLEVYPRATLNLNYVNPLDRNSIPLSIPRDGGDGYESAYNLPMEGKVHMLSFEHRSDDSPILIRQYYESWLSKEGFTSFYICKAPCSAASDKAYWLKPLDPNQLGHLYTYQLPEKATWIVGKRDDAAVIVGIGVDGNAYASIVKVIEGKFLDMKAWNAAIIDHPFIVPEVAQAAH